MVSVGFSGFWVIFRGFPLEIRVFFIGVSCFFVWFGWDLFNFRWYFVGARGFSFIICSFFGAFFTVFLVLFGDFREFLVGFRCFFVVWWDFSWVVSVPLVCFCGYFVFFSVIFNGFS